jgi:hypothetical protein
MPQTLIYFAFICNIHGAQVTATLAKREVLMNQKLAGTVILAADIDSRRASVLPQALQDKVGNLPLHPHVLGIHHHH